MTEKFDETRISGLVMMEPVSYCQVSRIRENIIYPLVYDRLRPAFAPLVNHEEIVTLSCPITPSLIVNEPRSQKINPFISVGVLRKRKYLYLRK